MNASPGRIAWVAGASGLTGRFLLDALLDATEYTRIVAITRRPLGRDHARIANRIVPKFDQLEQLLAGVGCQDAFCCIGTTRAKAGSDAAFRAVDLGEVLHFAKAARRAGAARFIVVSAVGAAAQSGNAYLRVKGEMEDAVATLGFAAIDIAQPGLLLGGERSESRPVESLARVAMPLLNPLLTLPGLADRVGDYRGIGADVLARAMVGMARSGRKGISRHRYESLLKLSRPREKAKFD